MKIIARIFFCFMLLGGKPGTALAQENAVSPNFYKRFTGVVAGQPVTAHLQRVDKIVRAWYEYRQYRQPIELYSAGNKKDPQQFVFFEGDTTLAADTTFPEWTCRLQDNRLTGTWKSADRKKTFPIALQEDYTGGAYRFGIRSHHHVFAAFPGMKKSPRWKTMLVYPVAAGNDARSQWLNTEIKSAAGLDTKLPFETAVKQRIRDDLEDYREEMKVNRNGPYKSYMDYETDLNVSISYNGNDYVIFASAMYMYEGAAHGAHAVSYSLCDVRNRKELTVEDVVNIDSLTLQTLLESRFRKDNSLTVTDSLNTILFKNHLPPTDNCYFTNEGLVFVYNPYEVASYATGIIEVLLPYKEIATYLVPAFRQRMNITISP